MNRKQRDTLLECSTEALAVPPSVDVLAIIHKRVDLAIEWVPHYGKQGLSPQRSEVLSFVDDDGIERF